MTPAVRPAGPADAPAIRAVYSAAFPTSAEADLVARLEAEGDAVISLVAERDGEVIGHVLLSRMSGSGGGRTFRSLGLGPVAVRPDAQRSGTGSRLIEVALIAARMGGEELIFVVGEPGYYERFGFSTAVAAPFACAYAGAYFMALALRNDLALPVEGVAEYPRAFADLG